MTDAAKPVRAISRTLLPDGATVLEVGDDVLHLTPRESRMLGEVMAGSAQAFAAIEIGHEAARLNAHLSAQVREAHREVSQLQGGG